MRCGEVKRLLRQGDVSNPEVLEHIRQCRDCALEARSIGLIDESLEIVRKQPPAEPTAFGNLRARLESQPTSARKEYSRMAETISSIGRHKKTGLALGLAVVVLLFVTLVPFTYDRVVGCDVTIADLPVGAQIDINPTLAALSAMGYDNVSISTSYSPTGTDVYITNLPEQHDAQMAAAVFSKMTGLSGQTEYTPHIETVSGSLYAQIRDEMSEITIVASGETPEEMKANVEAQLEGMGFAGSEATVTSDGNGNMQIEISIPGDSGQ